MTVTNEVRRVTQFENLYALRLCILDRFPGQPLDGTFIAPDRLDVDEALQRFLQGCERLRNHPLITKLLGILRHSQTKVPPKRHHACRPETSFEVTVQLDFGN